MIPIQHAIDTASIQAVAIAVERPSSRGDSSRANVSPTISPYM